MAYFILAFVSVIVDVIFDVANLNKNKLTKVGITKLMFLHLQNAKNNYLSSKSWYSIYCIAVKWLINPYGDLRFAL